MDVSRRAILQGGMALAAAQLGVPVAASRQALAQARPAGPGELRFLDEGGRSGFFVWTAGDFARAVAKDPPLGPYGQGLVIAAASDPQGRQGAWLRHYEGDVNIRWFGARGIGSGFDDAPAFRAYLSAIRQDGKAGRADNGRCIVPATGAYYYFASTVEVNQSVVFAGEGAANNEAYSATIIKVPAGVTAFYSTVGPHPNGPLGLQLRDLHIAALGKAGAAGSARVTPRSNRIALAAPGDFRDGQVILIRGAGAQTTEKNGRFPVARIEAGDTRLSFEEPAGLVAGWVIDIPGAGLPPGTSIAARENDRSYRLSRPARSTAAAPPIVWEDFAARIVAGGGTTDLTLSDRPFADSGARPLADARVEHYDCGVYTESQLHLFGNVTCSGFGGAGIFYCANSAMENAYGRQANCNQSQQVGSLFLFGNRNGVRVQGSDCNVMTFAKLDGFQNSEYTLMDSGGLGNIYVGCHTSGTYGYRTTRGGAKHVFVGCYAEGGTECSFAGGTMIVGGFIGSAIDRLGGAHLHGDDGNWLRTSAMRLFPSAYTLGVNLADRNLANGLLLFDNSKRGGSSAHCAFAWSQDVQPGSNDGLLGMYDANAQRWPIAWSDSGHARGAGNLFLPQGCYLGNGRGIAQSDFRRRLLGSAPPDQGSWDRGDRIENEAPARGVPLGWVCVAGGTPGEWAPYGNIG